MKLLEVCKQVAADPSKAEELLPTQSGFFFGGTEYDEYYMNSIPGEPGSVERCDI